MIEIKILLKDQIDFLNARYREWGKDEITDKEFSYYIGENLRRLNELLGLICMEGVKEEFRETK